MTTVGKLLVFVNLVLGVGAAVWATAVYTQRPGWFTPPADGGVDKGNSPLTFKELTAEVDALGKAAAGAGAAWSTQYQRLTAAEQTRVVRQAQMFGGTAGGKKVRGLLEVARTGQDPARPGSPAFFNLKDDPATRLADLTPNPADKAAIVRGPDDLPLGGADTLLTRFNADAVAVGELADQSTKLRQQQKQLAAVVTADEVRVLKQREIREGLRNEAAFLAGLEINWADRRETVATRRAQLQKRLAVFRPRD